MKDNHYHHEEDFHARDRKLHRKERKHAIARDRSKYKKSDQDQIKKTHTAPILEEGMLRGRVLAITPEGIIVDIGHQQITCSLKGTLKYATSQMKNLVAVGDFVHLSPEGSIASIEERHSVLSRADNLSRNKQQLIAVNIDQVLITVSVVSPPLKPPLVDRYIIAARKGNMQPIIVINKIDLLENLHTEIYEEFLRVYNFIPIYPVSSHTAEGLTALKNAMIGKASVFSGQSGVGKSSLINALIGTTLATGQIVEKTLKGSHTTTSAQLIPIEPEGFLIDTPGIKSFGIWDLSPSEVQSAFPEIAAFAPQCKYPDCSHLQEPGCAVRLAVEAGTISPMRFASYSTLMASTHETHKHR